MNSKLFVFIINGNLFIYYSFSETVFQNKQKGNKLKYLIFSFKSIIIYLLKIYEQHIFLQNTIVLFKFE